MAAAKRTNIESIPPLLVTREEAAHFLRYGTTTIDQMIMSGQLKIVGKGRSMRIVFKSLELWVEQNSRFGN